MDDVERIVVKVVVLHVLGGYTLGGIRDFPAHSHDVQHFFLFIHRVGDNLGARLLQLRFHETGELVVEKAPSNDADSHDHCRNHCHHSYTHHQSFGLAFQSWSLELLAVEMHEPYAGIGGKADEYRIDEE